MVRCIKSSKGDGKIAAVLLSRVIFDGHEEVLLVEDDTFEISQLLIRGLDERDRHVHVSDYQLTWLNEIMNPPVSGVYRRQILDILLKEWKEAMDIPLPKLKKWKCKVANADGVPLYAIKRIGQAGEYKYQLEFRFSVEPMAEDGEYKNQQELGTNTFGETVVDVTSRFLQALYNLSPKLTFLIHPSLM